MPNTQPVKTFLFPVEAGKIREVADALHDERALFRSADVARDAGFPAIPAPLIFTRTSYFHSSELTSVSAQIGVDPNNSRHAGQEWSNESPLYAGSVYEVTAWRITGEEVKRNRAGAKLRFVTAEREFRSNAKLAIRERTTNVVLDAQAGRPTADAAAATAPSFAAGNPQWTRELRAFAGDWRQARPGDRLAEAVIGPLGLTDIVRFAGAIGDFTAIHHDPAVAQRSGLADIIAMGSFPVGLALGLAEEGYGISRLRSVRIRFHEPLYVNRSVTIRLDAAQDTSAAAPSADLDVRDSLGARILSGTVGTIAV
jgi:acyl dehydratase